MTENSPFCIFVHNQASGIGRSLHCRTLPAFVVDGVVTGEQDLRNRYDLIPLGEQVVEDIRQRLGRMLARIVEQHNRPALHLACHALRDLTRRNALPVEGIPTGSTWKRLRRLVFRSLMSAFLPAIIPAAGLVQAFRPSGCAFTGHTIGTAAKLHIGNSKAYQPRTDIAVKRIVRNAKLIPENRRKKLFPPSGTRRR